MKRVHSHYANLKVSRDAPFEVIRASYRVLAQKYHPDKNPDNANAAEVTAMLNEAYRVLSDASLRRDYDRSIASEESVETATEQSPTASDQKSGQMPGSAAHRPEASSTSWNSHTVNDPNAIDLDDVWLKFTTFFFGSKR